MKIIKVIGWGVLALALCALPIVLIILAPSIITGLAEYRRNELSGLFNDRVWPLNELGSAVYVVVAFLIIGGVFVLISFVRTFESQKEVRGCGFFFLAIGVLPFVFAILNIIFTTIKPVFFIIAIIMCLTLMVGGIYGSILMFIESIKEVSTKKEYYDIEESRKYMVSSTNKKIFIDTSVNDSFEKEVALCLANGLMNNNISQFLSLLDENVNQISYTLGHLGWNYKKDIGKQQVELYWKNWMIKNNASYRCYIFRDANLQKEILKIGTENNTFIIFTLNGQNKIWRIYVHDAYIYKTNYSNEKEELLPMLEKLAIHTVNIGFETDNHLPCINCGKESGDLVWFGYNTKDVHGGNISFCPTCRNVVEHIYLDVLRHINHQNSNPNIDENINYIKKALLFTDYEGRPQMYIGGRLVIPDNDVLKRVDNLIPGTIVDKLIYAANNGVYEAYNNLGFWMFGKNKEKVVEYFKLGIEHGVKKCILNLMFWYLAKNEDSLFVELVEQLATIKEPIGLYNYAVLLHAGKEFGFNPQVDKAVKYYREAIDESYKQQTEDENYKFILQNANYNLGLIFFEEYGEYTDLLQAYAYLNECPKQDEEVLVLKTFIYRSLCEMIGTGQTLK